MPVGIMNSLRVSLCKDADDAVAKGFDYKTGDFTAVNVVQVVVVKNGTEQNNPTVDFVLEDAAGNKYVFMVTARLLKALPL